MTYRVSVLTGSRADYGIIRPVLAAMMQSEALQPELLVTSMHLSQEFGHTVDRIVEDGFPIRERVDVLLAGDSRASMATSLGLAISLFSQSLEARPPDGLMVYGDRFEALAGAIAASYVGVPVVHMHGGDHAAGYSIDDSNRHAITKFAHLHLPATENHAARIRRMGEAPERIVVVGSPALDSIRAGDYTRPDELKERLGLPFQQPSLLVVQHPVTAETMDAEAQIIETLAAVRALDLPTLWLYPNADPGSGSMIRVLESAADLGQIVLRRSIAHQDFLGAMAGARVMIGNSSSALIEAPSFNLPAVNVGTRQADRGRGANVVDVGYSRADIERETRSLLADETLRDRLRNTPNPYGDGRTAERVVRTLEQRLGNRQELLRKSWSD